MRILDSSFRPAIGALFRKRIALFDLNAARESTRCLPLPSRGGFSLAARRTQIFQTARRELAHGALEVALAALKDYLRKRKGSIDALVEAARADRIYAFMRPQLEALA